jgi:hypothetical protein
MFRGSEEAARDMDAGDEGAVWGRGDGLLTGFWRGLVCSLRQTVLDLADSGASKRRGVGEGVSEGTIYVTCIALVNPHADSRPRTEMAYQQQGQRRRGHR